MDKRQGVGAEKRRKIQQLVSRYSYVPNAMAQDLRRKTTNIITFMLPSIRFFDHPVHNRLLVGLQNQLEQFGYQLDFSSLSEGYKKVNVRITYYLY